MSRFVILSRRDRRRAEHRPGRPRRRWLAAVSAVASAALLGAMTVLVAPQALADQGTQGVDDLRTNWDASEPGLSPALVQSSAFGQLFATKLDGQIYAQPLVIGDEVVAVTESNTVYGLDRTSGAIRWSHTYGATWPASAIGCGDLTPDVGATATPVYDPATSTLYFTTKVDDGTTTHRHPTWLMHAVDPASGAERTGWPVSIAGSPDNDPGNTFDAFYEQQRPGLLLMDGVVYAGFGGHCDVSPYRGYVVGVDTATHSITSLWGTETGAGVNGAGIWQAGGGLVSDGPGRIFFSTGNGISPAPGPGGTVQGTLAESVVRLQVNADRSLSTADFFSPSNAATLDLNDQDISSGAPMALPDGFGTTAHPHLMVEQGKDGRIFLLDRDHLGGMGQGASGGDAAVGVTGPYQGLWGHPAFFGGDGGYVYVIGNNGPLRALKYGLSSLGTPALTLTGQSQDMFGYTSGSPLVTSDGTDDSTALVWVVSANGASGAGGVLRAYSPTPDGNGRLQPLWSAPIGTATKFSTPTANAGKIYVGTRDGILYGFGSPARTALTAGPLDFGQVAVGSPATGTTTLTATQDVAITGLTASGPFTVTGAVPTPTNPEPLASGLSRAVPIGFTPTTTGGVNGTLTATLSGGQRLVFALHGVGTRAGLGAAPGTVDFGQIPTGTTSTLNLQITNTGTAVETVTSVTSPSGAFVASGLPVAGAVVPVGGSFVVTVMYTPTTGGTATSTLAVASSSGGTPHTVTVPVTGSAITGRGHLEFTPTSLAFGAVPVGSSKTLPFTIANTGNIPVSVTKAKAPTGDFTSPVQLSEGLVIGPGQTVVQNVTFTPRSAAAQSAFYEVTATGSNTDGTPQGAQTVPITGSGTGAATTVSTKDGLWQANGTTVFGADGSAQLTSAVQYQTGTAVYTKALPTEGLRATFTAQFGPGNGGDGTTFALLDPAQNTPGALGGWQDGGLGIGGRPGVVVALDTGWNSTLRMQNFVGVGYTTAGATGITYTAVAKLSTSLRQGTHQIDLQVTGGHVHVRVDGTQMLDATATLTANALIAFSGATSYGYDVHAVSGLVVSVPPPPVPPSWSGYSPVAPARALATRSIPTHGKVTVALAGHYGVPADATSVLVDVGASGTKTATGAVMVQPHGAAVPGTGTVYWNSATQYAVRSAAVRLGGGAVDVYNGSTGTAPVFVDVLGYYAPNTGKRLTRLRAGYVLNTAQAGVGQPKKAPIASHATITVPVRGMAGVPSTATSVVLSLASGTPGTSGSLAVWPHGGARPAVPLLAWTAKGDQASNLVTVPLSADGRIDLYNSGTSGIDVTAAAVGYYDSTAGRTFVPTTTTTVLDTRHGIGRAGTSPLAAAATLVLPVAGHGVVPTGATAVLIQMATVPTASATGSLTVWTDATTRPAPANVSSNLSGHTTTNLVLVPLGSNGKLDIRNNGTKSAAAFGAVVGYWIG